MSIVTCDTYFGKRVRSRTADELVEYWRGIFGDDILALEVRKRTAGVQRKMEYPEIWLTIKRERFHSLVLHMSKEQVPHLAVASGVDEGEEIHLTYHFTLYYGIPYAEIPINIKVPLPKSDPVIDTITDILPGALITEREKQEMLGVVVRNIPDPRRIFTGEIDCYYPWRKDNDPELEKKFHHDLSEVGL